MSKKAPFAKASPAQYQRPEFYWRGGNVLKEKEYLVDEYKKALTDFRKAESEYKQVQADLEIAHQELKTKEGYTSALANYLESDTEGSFTESQLKTKLVELETEISQLESELAQVKAIQNPAVASSLQKEKAFLSIQIQQLIKSNSNCVEKNNFNRRRVAQIAISQRYQNQIELEKKISQMNRKRKYLRTVVNELKVEFDQLRPSIVPSTHSIREEKAVLLKGAEIEVATQIAQEKLKRHPPKYNLYFARTIDDIEELNQRLIDLRDEDSVVSTDELRTKYRFEQEQNAENQPSDEEEQSSENQH